MKSVFGGEAGLGARTTCISRHGAFTRLVGQSICAPIIAPAKESRNSVVGSSSDGPASLRFSSPLVSGWRISFCLGVLLGTTLLMPALLRVSSNRRLQ